MLMDLNKISIDILIKFCDCQEFDLVIERGRVTSVVNRKKVFKTGRRQPDMGEKGKRKIGLCHSKATDQSYISQYLFLLYSSKETWNLQEKIIQKFLMKNLKH